VRLLVTSCIVALLCAGVSFPHAQADKPKNSSKSKKATKIAKAHFYRGQRLFDLRRFKQALRAYEQAYEAKAIPAFLFNIGQCHYNLGDFESALFSYRRFLKLSPRTPKRKAVERLIVKLELELEESRKAAAKKRNGGIEPVPRPTPKPQAQSQPVYKKWWFWTGIAVVGAASAAAIVGTSSSSNLPSSDLGNLDFSR